MCNPKKRELHLIWRKSGDMYVHFKGTAATDLQLLPSVIAFGRMVMMRDGFLHLLFIVNI